MKIWFLILALAFAPLASARDVEPIAPIGDAELGHAIFAGVEFITIPGWGTVESLQYSNSGEPFMDVELGKVIGEVAAQTLDAAMLEMDPDIYGKGGWPDGPQGMCPGNQPGNNCVTIDHTSYSPCQTCGIIVTTIITFYNADGEVTEIRTVVNHVRR